MEREAMTTTKKRWHPGDRVRGTGEFLRNTGQVVGGEGQSRWTVQACCCGLCESGRFVAVDETSYFEGEAEGALRHINSANLERARR